MARTRTWSTTIPVDHTQIKNLPDSTRDVREDLEERVDGILAGFVNTGATNGLLLGRLLTVGTNNALTPGTGTAGAYDIYCLTTGSTMELFGKDNAGNIVQFTRAGKMLALEKGDFRTGDILLSSNTGTPNGWTEITSTYDGKFLRIGTGTALGTGGADTHTHAIGTYAASVAQTGWGADGEAPSASHAVTSGKIIVGSGNVEGVETLESLNGANNAVSATMSGTSASANNIPAYVQLKMYSKS